MSKFVLCTHRSASDEINGIAFEAHPEGKISVELVGEGDCSRFERIPGYELRDSKDPVEHEPKPKPQTTPKPGKPNSVRNAPAPKPEVKAEEPQKQEETPPPAADTENKDPAAGGENAPDAPAAGTEGEAPAAPETATQGAGDAPAATETSTGEGEQPDPAKS
jgi:outer membrane biosynthesis protein TonB